MLLQLHLLAEAVRAHGARKGPRDAVDHLVARAVTAVQEALVAELAFVAAYL